MCIDFRRILFMKNFSGFNYLCSTETVFGKDTEMQTASMIRKYGGTKVMIILGSSGFARQTGLLERVTGALDEANIPYIELVGVQRNPRLSFILKGIELARREKVNFLLAIGGGSVIDTGKAIAAGMKYDGDMMDFYTRKVVPEEIAPLGVICTYAGSGSETSGGTIALDDITTNAKHSYRYGHNRARFAIMNPELTYTVSSYMTASGAVDIFGHAIEAYFNYGTSYLGDQFCESCMRASVKYGLIAVENPTDYEARAELMMASSFAHNDVCRIGRSVSTGGVVNLERHLSAAYDTLHGAGVAVVMPAWIQCMIDYDETALPQLVMMANRVFGVEADPFNPKEVAREGLGRMRSWLNRMGMPSTLHKLLELDVSDVQIEEILNAVNFDKEGVFKGFGQCTWEQIHDMFISIR